MKLVGSVRAIERIIAKQTKDAIDEKRVFKINVSPASKPDSAYYGYGNLQFAIHGQELADLGVDLGDELEVFVVKKGTEYSDRTVEDTRHDLYLAQEKIKALEKDRDNTKNRLIQYEKEWRSSNTKSQALQLENVKLMTENLTLRAMFKPQDLPTMIPSTIDGN